MVTWWFVHGFSPIRSAVSGIAHFCPNMMSVIPWYLHKMVGHGGLIIFLSQRGLHFQGQLPFGRVRFPRRSHGCCNDGIDPDFEAKQKNGSGDQWSATGGAVNWRFGLKEGARHELWWCLVVVWWSTWGWTIVECAHSGPVWDILVRNPFTFLWSLTHVRMVPE